MLPPARPRRLPGERRDRDGDAVHLQVAARRPACGRQDQRLPLPALEPARHALGALAELQQAGLEHAPKGKTEWTVPYVGLLNPNTDYYWRVRARTGKKVWGPWGPVRRFRCDAPGVPLEVAFNPTRSRPRSRWRGNPIPSAASRRSSRSMEATRRALPRPIRKTRFHRQGLLRHDGGVQREDGQ